MCTRAIFLWKSSGFWGNIGSMSIGERSVSVTGGARCAVPSRMGTDMKISCECIAWAILTLILVAAPLTLFAAGGTSQDKALLTARDAFLAGDGSSCPPGGKGSGPRARTLRRATGGFGCASSRPIRVRCGHSWPGTPGRCLPSNCAGIGCASWGRTGNGSCSARSIPPWSGMIPMSPAMHFRGMAPARTNRCGWGSTPSGDAAGAARGCAAVADAMLRSGDLTPRDLRDRFRLLVRADLITEAKRIAERMPADQAPRESDRRRRQSPAGFWSAPGTELETTAGRELAIVGAHPAGPERSAGSGEPLERHCGAAFPSRRGSTSGGCWLTARRAPSPPGGGRIGSRKPGRRRFRTSSLRGAPASRSGRKTGRR